VNALLFCDRQSVQNIADTRADKAYTLLKTHSIFPTAGPGELTKIRDDTKKLLESIAEAEEKYDMLNTVRRASIGHCDSRASVLSFAGVQDCV
jgi:hypothetical protein